MTPTRRLCRDGSVELTSWTHGTLAALTADGITSPRHEAAVRDIAVHFPRVGYRVFRQPAPA
jgi:hypothetical protein